MKSAELALKSALILEGAMGLYEKIFNTHKPLTDIKNHPLLGHIHHNLGQYRKRLPQNIEEVELLEPTLYTKVSPNPTNKANTTYPFFRIHQEENSPVSCPHSPGFWRRIAANIIGLLTNSRRPCPFVSRNRTMEANSSS